MVFYLMPSDKDVASPTFLDRSYLCRVSFQSEGRRGTFNPPLQHFISRLINYYSRQVLFPSSYSAHTEKMLRALLLAVAPLAASAQFQAPAWPIAGANSRRTYRGPNAGPSSATGVAWMEHDARQRHGVPHRARH
jgi:hypothetical protein